MIARNAKNKKRIRDGEFTVWNGYNSNEVTSLVGEVILYRMLMVISELTSLQPSPKYIDNRSLKEAVINQLQSLCDYSIALYERFISRSSQQRRVR